MNADTLTAPQSLTPIQVWEKVMQAALTEDGQPQNGWRLEEYTIKSAPRSVSHADGDRYEGPFFASKVVVSKEVLVDGKTLKFVLKKDLEIPTADMSQKQVEYWLHLTDQDNNIAYASDAGPCRWEARTPDPVRFSPHSFGPYEPYARELFQEAFFQTINANVALYRCHGCFTSAMQLQREDRSTVSFGELAAMAAVGQMLPKIASIDEQTRNVVYQVPTDVIDHGVQPGPVLKLNSGLEVTPNHPIYVSQPDGSHTWKPAGELIAGDCLTNPLSSCTPYVPSSTMTLNGAHQVFDLSMPGAHNFLVKSPNASGWIVAHNKTML